ncbi:ERAD-associated E3 ubiquitin-protein ligase HRD1B-like [Salvia hispanica]|uniref:ERAD-associated E3 ubiquitin-protein ligase HRD1B-like n=1 Tax=Salvia hispanica TaxID=49212 RepID=UPI002009A36C|nr:ERAD-associated E3 ubiquitin-protein ligase HRD1B-like [Salvia hispanica]XP_047958938.1 ERAD-associated E3 ubiquitin-protein ligase HRD1B-like [Salvia hispanica]
MMKLQTYAGFSVVAALAIIYHAFDSRGQFYPAMVYLSTSKISLVLLLNMGLVFMCILWQLTKKLFLGSLREAEVERLNEQSWREVMEILFAITIFRQDFSVTFLAMVTALLLIKSLHWLAQKRVEYIETTPMVPKLSHVRIVSFMVFLLLIDGIFLYDSVDHLLETRQASVALFFSFEYIILATTTLSTFVKYVFHVSDMLMEGQWEKKAVCTFYLELIRDLLHLTLCMCFFLIIFLNYGVPLHLIRELYETFRNFRIRVADYIRYRRVTSNMNDRFPDASPEELSVNDATCIICREEMTAAKKLVCGHLFHVNCLRSWLERQNTCPTCRALVIPPEHGTSTSSTMINSLQQGTGTAGTSTQGSSGDGVANDNVSQHQIRLQAAAAAASLYEKSFVYPSPNALMQSPGLASPAQVFQHSIMARDGREGAASEVTEQFSETTLNQFPHYAMAPNQFPHFNSGFGDGSSSESQLDLQRKLIEHQIEFLQNQLQLLRTSNREKMKDGGTSFDIKGKSVSSPSSPVIDSGET